VSLRSTARRLVASVTGRRRGGGGRSGGRRGGPAPDAIRIAYTPDVDGEPDPGEVVWTWVPYEDDPSQGKDRPVVVIGSIGADLAVVPLSSKDHDGRRDEDEWVPVGTGAWDGRQRPSYADTARVLRVAAAAVRREGAELSRDRFDAVVAVVRRNHPTTG
jgi:PemK-like, MazF-like toxin of type II toxin-antitoxin system